MMPILPDYSSYLPYWLLVACSIASVFSCWAKDWNRLFVSVSSIRFIATSLPTSLGGHSMVLSRQPKSLRSLDGFLAAGVFFRGWFGFTQPTTSTRNIYTNLLCALLACPGSLCRRIIILRHDETWQRTGFFAVRGDDQCHLNAHAMVILRRITLLAGGEKQKRSQPGRNGNQSNSLKCQ